jgi:small subunit ribosomal protein S3
MGQKVHPTGLRLGIIRTWDSRWYAEKDYAKLLHEDIRIRKFLKQKLYHAGISKIEIERAANKLKIGIWTARPGIVIGKKGAEIENLKKELAQYTTKEVFINIQEVRKAEINAQLVAENVATQLERRIAFRRAMKKAVTSAMKLGAKGIKIHSAGRLGGAEMSRREWYREGRVPLHTLRADVDYGFAEASTTYGKIGVKVWIFHGEILPESKGRADARRPGGPAVGAGAPGRAPAGGTAVRTAPSGD